MAMNQPPYPPHGPYPYPYPYPPPMMRPPQGNGLATAGMICGIVGLCLFFLWFLAGILGLLGIVFGAIGLSRAGKLGGRGKGLALTGIITGALAILLSIVFVVVVVRLVVDEAERYATRGRRREAHLQLKSIETKIKSYHIERDTLPDSAPLTPEGTPCSGRSSSLGKFQRVPQSGWTGGWQQMGFHIDEDSLFQYRWTKVSDRAGYAEAIGDLDCDTTMVTYRLEILVVDGYVKANIDEPTNSD